MKIKIFWCLIICTGLVFQGNFSFAQKPNDSLSLKKRDSGPALIKTKTATIYKKVTDTVNEQIKKIPVSQERNSSQAIIAAKPDGDTNSVHGSLLQTTDSLPDSLQAISTPVVDYDSIILSKNPYINTKGNPVFLNEVIHNAGGKEFLFYILCLVLLILGLFRTFFTGYFKNLFRVYFNTSLRQTQLSDQLRQATLPSLLLNIFFTITAGIYIWLLFNFYHPPKILNGRVLLPFSILSIAIIYFLKFCILKFLGWVSDVRESTNGYIFAIFLVNKITGIFLVPFIILLSFINPQWLPVIVNISFMLIALLFLSRYVKSYAIIERKIPLNPFHFAIYIAGAEIIPLFIIYKVAIDYLI